ncbi:MAG: C39 family peptidase [Nocardioides sp.]|uniref:C39 family peptidase n=1 Tax=Nocardioides sp. TaxID=35761 RepID=UPI0039E5D3FC
MDLRHLTALGAASALATTLLLPGAADATPASGTAQAAQAAQAGGVDRMATQAADHPTYRARTASAAGATALTPATRRAIDRMVRADRRDAVPEHARLLPRAALARVARTAVHCHTFEGQRYCVGLGWTSRSPAQVGDDLAERVAARRTGTDTGDLGPRATLLRLLSGTPGQRARRERAELTAAARAVAKVWLLRHQVQGVPLPAGFLARHPEARARSTELARHRSSASAKAYPQRATVLSTTRVSEQHRTYWCGPTTAQMIVWGWTHEKRSQKHWARRLGTTTAGSSISDMVRVVNNNTGWDKPSYAGKYIVLDIGDWSAKQWWRLIKRHISTYRAPVVLHPILLKKYFPYLDDDGSGHFQVGRGYDNRGKKTNLIGYFEPWNQQRFDPSEPYIARVQWRSGARSYRANEAHPMHDIGV